MDVFLKFVFIKESSDFGVLYVVCLATNARLHRFHCIIMFSANLRSGVPFVFVGARNCTRRSFSAPTKTKGMPDRRLV